MTAKLTIDNAGRVLLPKALRDHLNLESGDSLQLESHGEDIVLRPVRGTMPLRKQDGIWVFRTGEPLASSVTDRMIEHGREERDRIHTRTRR